MSEKSSPLVHSIESRFQTTSSREPAHPLPATQSAMAPLTPMEDYRYASSPIQRAAIPEATAGKTGLPATLKAGIEQLSGLSMEGVRVHYRSLKPARVQALAYAQGTDIHLAPGQEQHLPHEAWHVVQQLQDRVPATRQEHGVALNDHPGLEREADTMGQRALHCGSSTAGEIATIPAAHHPVARTGPPGFVAQYRKGHVIQRTIEPYNRRDNSLDAYLVALDGLVGAAATWALNVDNVPSGASGYYDRWKALGTAYIGNVGGRTPFLYAAYGYAVETRTNATLDTIANLLPHGWTVDKQVTQGMTRPDIVIFDDTHAQVAWIDLTSDSLASVGHIKKKAGGGWSSKAYVFEVTYPMLDTSLITQSGPPSNTAKLRAAVKAHKKARKDAEGTLGLSLDVLMVMNGLSRDSKPADAMAAFQARFPDEDFSHKKIRSIIELGGRDIRDFGYNGRRDRAGRNAAAAESFLARQFY